MTPQDYEEIGFSKFYDDVDGTADFYYEYKIGKSFVFFTDFMSDAIDGKLTVYLGEIALYLSKSNLVTLINVLKDGTKS